MNEVLEHVQARARELARSGKFSAGRAVAFELQFEPGFTEAFHWIYSLSGQEELDRLCSEARTGRSRKFPRVA